MILYLTSVRSFHLEFLENCCLARRLRAKLIWNILKLLIEKKIANELSIQTQCILPEEEGKCPKQYLLGMKIYPAVHSRVGHTLTDLLSVNRSDA